MFQVNVWNHRREGADQLARDIGPKAEAFDSVEDTVREADVIVTVTSSSVPVLQAEWVKPGAHINGESLDKLSLFMKNFAMINNAQIINFINNMVYNKYWLNVKLEVRSRLLHFVLSRVNNFTRCPT